MKLSKLAFCLLAVVTFSVQANALSSVQTTSVDYSSGMSAKIILANDQIHSDQSVSSMISSDTVMAVNGNFFNSYYSSSSAISYPSNCPIVYGAIISEGVVVNAGGSNNMLGFTYDGQILVDRVDVQNSIILNGKTTINAWGVNSYFADDSAIMIMSDDLNHSFNVASGATVYTIKDGVVTDISTATTHTVADGTMKVVYNSAALESSQKWNVDPKIGDKAEYTYTITPTTANSSWNNIETAVSGGRILVLNGVNVSASTTYNATFDSQDKQDNYSSLQRSYVYTTADGKLYFATAVGSFSEIAADLVSKGAVNAVSMDGGASSMLYSNGSYLTSAGRQLSNVLAIVADSDYVPPVYVETPSAWAVESVSEAIDLGFVPESLQKGYTTLISRGDFCELLYTYITSTTNKSMTTLISNQGENIANFTFDDTDSVEIRGIAALGIVNGTGDGLFKPNDTLTREQAATMISRMVDVLGYVKNVYEAPVFSDAASISWWAEEGVERVTSYKIMNGNYNGTFTPSNTYTVEQAIITIMNANDTITIK